MSVKNWVYTAVFLHWQEHDAQGKTSMHIAYIAVTPFLLALLKQEQKSESKMKMFLILGQVRIAVTPVLVAFPKQE